MRFVYLAGKIETARHAEASAFAAIFEQIHRMIQEADSVFSELHESVRTNREQIQDLVKIETSRFDSLEALLAA